MGYESERVAGIDHAAWHGDPNERPTVTDPGAAAGLFGWRQRSGYRRHRQVWTKTRPVTIPIGTRRAPAP